MKKLLAALQKTRDNIGAYGNDDPIFILQAITAGDLRKGLSEIKNLAAERDDAIRRAGDLEADTAKLARWILENMPDKIEDEPCVDTAIRIMSQYAQARRWKQLHETTVDSVDRLSRRIEDLTNERDEARRWARRSYKMANAIARELRETREQRNKWQDAYFILRAGKMAEGQIKGRRRWGEK